MEFEIAAKARFILVLNYLLITDFLFFIYYSFEIPEKTRIRNPPIVPPLI